MGCKLIRRRPNAIDNGTYNPKIEASDDNTSRAHGEVKPDWHDLPTEPGLWLVHAKRQPHRCGLPAIVTDEMMACIDKAVDADIRYCGPYALQTRRKKPN